MAGYLIYEGFFSLQTNLVAMPWKNSPFVFSKLKYESSAWGYNELEKYLTQLLAGKKPAVILDLSDKLKFIDKFRQKDVRRIKNNPSQAILIIYDPEINNVAKLWLYDRRYYYDGWPIISVDEYFTVLGLEPDYFQNKKITDYYYIQTTNLLFTGGNTTQSNFKEKMQKLIAEKKLLPIKELYSPQKEKVFEIYQIN